MDILSETEIDQKSSNDMFEDLTDRYGEAVYRFCRSLTYSKEDADDLFQETFAKIFEQPHKISGSDNPQAFIFSTALFIWKSWKRKYARRNRIAPAVLLDESVVFPADEASANIEEDYILREEIALTRKLVEELPEKFKTPVIMYYTMEMNLNDIAASMQIPEGTVKSRLFKARKIIEKGLEDNLL